MGLEDLLSLLANNKKTRELLKSLILTLRGREMTKEELLEELDISEKQFKNLTKRLRKVGLLVGEKRKDRYVYRLSYEGFGMWLKMLRDTVYNLIKRERE